QAGLAQRHLANAASSLFHWPQRVHDAVVAGQAPRVDLAFTRRLLQGAPRLDPVAAVVAAAGTQIGAEINEAPCNVSGSDIPQAETAYPRRVDQVAASGKVIERGPRGGVRAQARGPGQFADADILVRQQGLDQG